ncbi:biosynthetic-type acetolactate synthase large subunit, partial [Pseudomonas aeruginosa]
MELLSGAEMVVRSLRDEGVKYIYGYPGGALLHIYDALFKEHDVTHILVRHEQAATHMADGYARATGKPGVVLVTSGPGATNAITGIATAYMDSIPMVILSGQVPSNMVGTDAFQETDMVGISRPIVKHSFIIKHPSEIPEVIKKAFYLAQSGRPGPVVVDIPKDMGDPTQKFEYSYPKKVKLRSYSPAVRGHSGQIRKAAEMLLAAKRPVVYSGGGVIMGNAAAPLTELAQMLNLPVTNTLMGLGGYPGADRQFLGMLGMHGSFTANLAMHHSDVILAVGARFDDRVINGAAKFCPNAKIIHIDIDPASISKTIKADIPIVGPVDSVLTEMVAIVREIGETPNQDAQAAWWKQIDEWRGNRGLFPYDKGDGSIIKPQTVIETLYEVTHGDA